MAYRWWSSLLFLLCTALWAVPASAGPKIALVVDGGGERRDELAAALAKALDATPATTPARPTDNVGLQALRTSLEAGRLVLVRIEQQGRDRFTLTVLAVDESGVTRRFGDATSDRLVSATLDLVKELPPVPTPPAPAPPPVAAAPTAPPETTPPATGAVEEEKPKTHAPERIYKRFHPYEMLIAGAVTFFLPYFATVGVAANYEKYNANAARQGYIPIAGPFLARARINDKDLRDGYDPGLMTDGIVQVLTFNLLIAGIVYCAVGEKREVKEQTEKHALVRPVFSVGPGQAHLGAAVTW